MMSGIVVKNLTPVNMTPSTEVNSTLSSNADRQFFSHNINRDHLDVVQAREDLSYFISKYNNDNSLNQFSSKRTEEERSANILASTPQLCQNLMWGFLQLGFMDEVMTHLVKILEVCASERSLNTLINFRFIPVLSSIIEQINNGIYPTLIESLSSELPEVYNIYHSVSKYPHDLAAVNSFFSHVVQHISTNHATDQTYDAVNTIKKYNPEAESCAYYFTKSGDQLRTMKNYPEYITDLPDSCKRQNYLQIGKHAPFHLYVVLDTKHYGHCYGFHLTDKLNAKELFCPLYMFKEVPPKEYFCDNGCATEEFVLNREPSYFRNCRFFNNGFQGYVHKCLYTHNSKRVPSLSGVNTEISEQFRSFMKNIRSTAILMEKTNFIFFLQFFIHQWNVMRKSEYQEEMKMIRNFREPN